MRFITLTGALLIAAPLALAMPVNTQNIMPRAAIRPSRGGGRIIPARVPVIDHNAPSQLARMDLVRNSIYIGTWENDVARNPRLAENLTPSDMDAIRLWKERVRRAEAWLGAHMNHPGFEQRVLDILYNPDFGGNNQLRDAFNHLFPRRLGITSNFNPFRAAPAPVPAAEVLGENDVPEPREPLLGEQAVNEQIGENLLPGPYPVGEHARLREVENEVNDAIDIEIVDLADEFAAGVHELGRIP